MSKCKCQDQLIQALEEFKNGSVVLPDGIDIRVQKSSKPSSAVCYECRKASRCRRAWCMVCIVVWTSITLGAGIHWINYLITNPLP